MGGVDDEVQLVCVVFDPPLTIPLDALREALDRCDRLVKLVGDAGAKLSQACELCCLNELQLVLF